MNQQIGLIGRKLGMTQLFAEDGEVTPVTVIETGPNTVLQVKSTEGADGYAAIQLGFGARKAQRVNRAETGHLKKSGAEPAQTVRELRIPPEAAGSYTPGQQITAGDTFTAGEFADVIGVSKGRGFKGVMVRHNFRGFERSHGAHEYFRHGGSIGTRLTPGHVMKGKKMPGQMGNERVTVQNLKIVKVDAERNLVYVRGGVPGPQGATVIVRKATKKG